MEDIGEHRESKDDDSVSQMEGKFYHMTGGGKSVLIKKWKREEDVNFRVNR
jgi:hypothetical protein